MLILTQFIVGHTHTHTHGHYSRIWYFWNFLQLKSIIMKYLPMVFGHLPLFQLYHKLANTWIFKIDHTFLPWYMACFGEPKIIIYEFIDNWQVTSTIRGKRKDTTWNCQQLIEFYSKNRISLCLWQSKHFHVQPVLYEKYYVKHRFAKLNHRIHHHHIV